MTFSTGISSRVLKSNTTSASPHNPSVPFHKIRNASLVDPSIWSRLVTVVLNVPPAYLGVLTVYTTESVSESRIVPLKISPSSPGVKERFMFGGALGRWRWVWGT